MKNIRYIVERELRAYFSSPIAYVVLTVFALLSGAFFYIYLSQALQMALMNSMRGAQFGQAPPPMDLPGMVSQGFFNTMSVILLFIIPMMTMGLISEEKRRGTIELLLTAPITDAQVVLGKFLGAVSFFVILLLTSLVPMAVLFVFGKPAAGPILSGYLGLLLYGLSMLAVGLFLSSLTENQIISAVLGFGVGLILWITEAFTRSSDSAWKGLLTYLSVLSHLDDFFKGVLNTSNVIFYLSLMLVALFLTYRTIDSLRWRG